jgi:hypothetical protein
MQMDSFGKSVALFTSGKEKKKMENNNNVVKFTLDDFANFAENVLFGILRFKNTNNKIHLDEILERYTQRQIVIGKLKIGLELNDDETEYVLNLLDKEK